MIPPLLKVFPMYPPITFIVDWAITVHCQIQTWWAPKNAVSDWTAKEVGQLKAQIWLRACFYLAKKIIINRGIDPMQFWVVFFNKLLFLQTFSIEIAAKHKTLAKYFIESIGRRVWISSNFMLENLCIWSENSKFHLWRWANL